MAVLPNSQHEVVAQGLSRGLSRVEAHREAGYTGGASSASQIGGLPDVQERLGEIVKEAEQANPARLLETIVALLKLSEAADGLKSAAGVKEARIARLEALRLRELFDKTRSAQAAGKPSAPLTDAQWLAAFGPKG
jgi:hypothetical protein